MKQPVEEDGDDIMKDVSEDDKVAAGGCGELYIVEVSWFTLQQTDLDVGIGEDD